MIISEQLIEDVTTTENTDQKNLVEPDKRRNRNTDAETNSPLVEVSTQG
jgi:hypothetical protein